VDRLESFLFLCDDGLPYFGRIIRFTRMFSIDGFGKDTEVVFLGCLENPHIFIDPEMGQAWIDESIVGFPDEDRNGGKERVSFLVGSGRMDGIENVGETENGGDTERGLRDRMRFFSIERPLVVVGNEGNECVIESVGPSYFSGEILMRIDDFAQGLIRVDA